MNRGLWISFPLSSGVGDRGLRLARLDAPPLRFLAGAADDAPKHLPNPINR